MEEGELSSGEPESWISKNCLGDFLRSWDPAPREAWGNSDAREALRNLEYIMTNQ
jgi:hypothetical protein